MAKNAYEIRMNVLEMARQTLYHNHENKMEAWRMAAHASAGYAKDEPPAPPTSDEIIEEAKKLSAFINDNNNGCTN